MKSTVIMALAAFAATAPAPAGATNSAGSSSSADVPGRLVVTYQNTVSAMNVGEQFSNSEIIEVGSESLEAVRAQLESHPDVARVENDYWVSNPVLPSPPRPADSLVGALSVPYSDTVKPAGFVPSDPGFRSQIAWEAPQTGRAGVQDILSAYLRATPQRRVRIGVVDSGFYRLQDLDYAQGYNFASADGFGPRFLENEVDPNCLTAHGTGVSGVFGAVTNNGTGIAGIVETDIIAARALSCDSEGRVRGVLTDTALAIRWLAGDPSVANAPRLQQPVDVINASLGGQVSRCPGYLQEAIDYAYSRGILTVVSAGNAGGDAANTAPANCSRVVTVAAVRASGDLADFSNTGADVSVAALGSEVLSLDRFGRLTFWDGTSFSAPVVAGIAGLLKQSSTENLTPANITDLLRSSARLIRQSDGSRIPVVDAKAAMARVANDSGNRVAVIAPFLNDPERCQTEAYRLNNPLALSLDRVYEVTANNLSLGSAGERYTVLRSIGSGGKEVIAQSLEPVFLIKNVNPDTESLWIDVCDSSGQNCRLNQSQALL